MKYINLYCYILNMTDSTVLDIKGCSQTMLFLLLLLVTVAGHHFEHHNMEKLCGKTINMRKNNIHAIRLRPSPWPRYKRNMHCRVTLITTPTHRLHVVIPRLKIEFEPHCDHDYLSLFDGNETSTTHLPGLPRRLCGILKPNGAYSSSGHILSVYFKSDSFQSEEGFDLVITSYHEGTCSLQYEVECANNKRCISKSLKCDGLDNCGDKSDECRLTPESLIAILIGITFVTAIGIVVVSIGRRKHKARKKKDKMKEGIDISTLHDSQFVIERSGSLFPEDDLKPTAATTSKTNDPSSAATTTSTASNDRNLETNHNVLPLGIPSKPKADVSRFLK